MDANERNKKASEYTYEKINNCIKHPILLLKEDNEYMELIDSFVKIKQKGFRGIVLTAIVGKYLNKDFNPTTQFYNCNPRSIFEKGIRHALIKHKIPHGKSDPLNVAKNIDILDESWAKGKRPESAALAVVTFLRKLQDTEYESEKYKKLTDLFFMKLVELKDDIAIISTKLPNVEQSELIFAEKLAKFIHEAPEGGAVPQFVFGALLMELRASQKTKTTVHGANDSVFSTNTASRKPGDIWEETTQGEVIFIYEVTVKPIDINRLQDCAENISNLKLNSIPVKFLCRIPEDIKSLPLKNDSRVFIYQNVVFEFISLSNWTVDIYTSIPTESQESLKRRVAEFIASYDREINTKKKWNIFFNSHRLS